MAPYETLYGRRYRSPVGWLEPGKARLLGTDLVRDALEKEARDVTYILGEKVLLRVWPMKGVIRFGKNGQLNPRYIGLFEVLDTVEKLAYRLYFPPSLSGVHPLFHVSMLQKYYGDPSHVLDFCTVQLERDLTYDAEPVAIFDQHV
ncbi:uncharacterized protein [Nicotiana sylvestris]|uniref:uncharacterized protein n=1 Tax=Nicotiana sylvestris TaxID=4096 RepID=UPI00388CD1C0